MTNVEVFRKLQRPLLTLANNKYGRQWLGITQKPFSDEKILEIGPNHIWVSDGNKFRGKFMVGQPVFAKKLYLATIIGGLSVAELLRYFGLSGPVLFPLIGLTTYNVGSGDGYVGRDTGTETWTQARDTADGSDANATNTGDNAPNSTYTGTRYYNYRMFFPADTSGIGSGFTVTAATFNTYCTATSNVDTTSVDMVQTSQASASTLATTDYDNYTNTSIGNKTIASFNTNAFNLVTITDLSAINKTGTTLIGAITNRDLANSAPTGDDHISVQNSEGANKPYYDVTASVTTLGSYGMFL